MVPPQSQHPHPPGSRSGEAFLRFPCGQEFICSGAGNPRTPRCSQPAPHHSPPSLSLLTFLRTSIASYTLGSCRRSSDTRTARFSPRMSGPLRTVKSFHSCKKRCYCGTVCFLITFLPAPVLKTGYLAPSLLCPQKCFTGLWETSSVHTEILRIIKVLLFPGTAVMLADEEDFQESSVEIKWVEKK